MNFELFMPCPHKDVQRMAVDRAIHLGWDGIVLTTTITEFNQLAAPLEPVELNPECKAIVERNYGLCVLGSYPPFPQFTRLNLETGNVNDVNALIRASCNIKHSLISITPLNDAVFKLACQCKDKDIDIISIDVSKYEPKKKWKEAKAAVSKGIVIELLYSNFLTDKIPRQAFISAFQSANFILRGRNILMSFGSEDTDLLRSPSDVVNIASIFPLSNPRNITNTAAKKVLAKGLARQTHVGITRLIPKREESEDESDSSDLEIVLKPN